MYSVLKKVSLFLQYHSAIGTSILKVTNSNYMILYSVNSILASKDSNMHMLLIQG